MSSKIWIWKKVPGIAGRCNNIIYSRATLSPSKDILIFFGGDVQDIQENMEKHGDSKKYKEWSLENTAQILSRNFPKKHVLVIQPSRMFVTKNAVFSCFDNFVPGNEYGVPQFRPTHNALKHLQELVTSALEHFKICNPDEDNTNVNIEDTTLTLMGFSKGCVVLNQLLHEFHFYQNQSETNTEIMSFVRLIQSMWWLDGGHAGSKDTWITDKSILRSFAKLRIHVHVHVTPYQVQDSHRPWIRTEENYFFHILHSMGVSIERTLHFADKQRSLKAHFNVLKVIGNSTV